MKISNTYFDLTVGSKVYSDSDEGIVIDTKNAGEIVTVAWIGNRVIEDYNEDMYNEYAFTAYGIV